MSHFFIHLPIGAFLCEALENLPVVESGLKFTAQLGDLTDNSVWVTEMRYLLKNHVKHLLHTESMQLIMLLVKHIFTD